MLSDTPHIRSTATHSAQTHKWTSHEQNCAMRTEREGAADAGKAAEALARTAATSPLLKEKAVREGAARGSHCKTQAHSNTSTQRETIQSYRDDPQ